MNKTQIQIALHAGSFSDDECVNFLDGLMPANQTREGIVRMVDDVCREFGLIHPLALTPTELAARARHNDPDKPTIDGFRQALDHSTDTLRTLGGLLNNLTELDPGTVIVDRLRVLIEKYRGLKAQIVDDNDTILDLRQRNEEIHERVEERDSEISLLREDNQALRNRVASLEQTVSDLKTRLALKETTIFNLNRDVQSLNEKIDAIRDLTKSEN